MPRRQSASGDGLIISSSNPINPFGVTFGQNTVPGDPNSGYGFQTRLTGAGTRVHTYCTDTGQINAGLRGNFGEDSSWSWDASVNYGHTKRDQRDTNEVDIAGSAGGRRRWREHLQPGRPDASVAAEERA